jgi:hypothetical protein
VPIDLTVEPVPQSADRLRGTPEQVTESLRRFTEVGVRTVALQFLVDRGRFPERLEQMERFAAEVMPNLEPSETP